jgi:hypothetical protein
MSAPTMKRWVCPNCSGGLLAPSRPRKDDVRRYCLGCSKRTGRLVERTCPALERERATSREARSTRAKTQRQTVTRQKQAAAALRSAKLDARFVVRSAVEPGATVDLRNEVARVWRAARKVEPRLRERPPVLVASAGSGSYAYTYDGEIHLGQGADWMTLVHEVAHFVRARQGNEIRSDGKRAVHDRAFYFVLRDVVEKLVPGLRVSFSTVTAWGYVVDGIISRQVRALRDEREDR